jgi:hypothetical protein
MKFRKKFLIVFSSAIFSLFSVTAVVVACAGEDWEFLFNSFFDPSVTGNSRYQQFYRVQNWPLYNGYKDNYNQQFDSINVSEWNKFFNNSVDKDDIYYLLYVAGLPQIDTLIFYIKDPAFKIHPATKSISITKAADKKAAKEFLYYIGFARRCSEHVTRSDNWEYEEKDYKKSAAEISQLTAGAERLLKSVRNDFIRERYFFQLTRLYYFLRDYKKCTDYYEAHKDSFRISESMKYRSMSYAAGAYRKQKKTAAGNYLFAKVYDGYDELKETAYLSFAPQEEADLQESVDMGRNAREKCAVWHVAGIKEDPLRSMENIYKVDPKSDLLELLLTRAINLAEENIIPTGYYYDSESRKNGNNLKKDQLDQNLLTFVTYVAGQGNTEKPYLWNMAAGYLQTIAGNFPRADKFLAKAVSQSAGDSIALKQIRIIQITGNILKFSPDAAGEKAVTPDLKWLKDANTLRSGEAYDWAVNRLAQIYYSKGDTIKAVCINHYIDREYFFRNDFLERMMLYLGKDNKTEFESFITSLYPYSINTLLDMQGVNLLYSNRMEEAREKFVKAGDSSLESDPFTIRLKDCRDCDQADYKGGDSKVSYIDEMLDLLTKAESDKKNQAMLYFQIANGYYNRTYFGNCRNLFLTSMFQPGLLWFGYSRDAVKLYHSILDCSLAEQYYIKALNASNNIEFRAKCAFMAAKCEQNSYFASPEFDESRIIRSGKYYNLLKSQYNKTKYYQEIIAECGYFRTFLGR